ncbi:MAG: SCP2 sterol-binding domain-containing protein [Spirochaetes bacterium]|jgi:hypothetical protein|nr:SCP2 sterol-binding domain-containing protein [Spirochaetota bacterium]
MGFSIAIWGLSVIMRILRLFSSRFREALAGKNMVVVIRTEDASVSRYYRFENGKITTKGENVPNADMAMIWKDAKTAFSIMKQGKPEAMLEAGMNGNLRFDGDPEKSMAFMNIMTEMMDILKPAKD